MSFVGGSIVETPLTLPVRYAEIGSLPPLRAALRMTSSSAATAILLSS